MSLLASLLGICCLATPVWPPVPVSCTTPRALLYTQPATDWMTEALPIGNGYAGAMFFGGLDEEHVQFSEGSLWAGGPGSNPAYQFGNRPGAAEHLGAVRERIAAGDLKGADQLANTYLTGVLHDAKQHGIDFGDYGAQQPMGDLFVTVDHEGTPTDYTRGLDLSTGVGTVAYQSGGVQHTRSFYGSYPRSVLAYHFANDAAGGTGYAIRLQTPHPIDVMQFHGDVLTLRGHVADNGLAFEVCLLIRTDGKLSAAGDAGLSVTGARSLTLYQFAATAYRNQYPDYRGNDFAAANRNALEALRPMPDAEIYQEYLADYRHLFDRCTLQLCSPAAVLESTDTRLDHYAQGAQDPGLESLLVDYARYLTIAASRKGALPMHLQGKWNHETNPPWACDYHTNINLQMLYWPAEPTQLTECTLPLLDYIGSLVPPGRRTAQTHFGTRGWVVNTMNNAFGFTAPGWQFPWGYFPAGAGWLCQHLWDHYDYTGDLEYLRNTAYPVMAEACLFWMDYLQQSKDGQLVSCPSYSPEHGGISAGASMDHQIAWDLLNNTLQAAKALNIDHAFTQDAARTRDQIAKPMVGRWGQLQEWMEDLDDPKDDHRHVSHLFALYPGAQIDLRETPAWAEAARKSLDARGDSGTGWSIAWKICFWARLGDGDRAYRLLRRFLQPTSVKTVQMNLAGGVYSNLFCAHPPFQLDGNMGSAAGITEMLLQSQGGVLRLLPALPSAWPEGQVTGLAARGGFVVDQAWKDGVLQSATIQSRAGGTCRIRYRLPIHADLAQRDDRGDLVVTIPAGGSITVRCDEPPST